MGHTNDGNVYVPRTLADAAHMAERIREASDLAARHVGLPLFHESPALVPNDNCQILVSVRHHAFQTMAAACLLSAGTGPTSLRGGREPDTLANAIRWMVEVSQEYGILDGANPYNHGGEWPPEPEWDTEPAPEVEALLPAGQWPTTAHLRLHYLADIGDGWFCRDCRVGLIDVCRDDDTITDSSGRRLIKPGCNKRLPTRDHRVPQSLGGSHGPENLDLVCRPCNSAKGAA